MTEKKTAVKPAATKKLASAEVAVATKPLMVTSKKLEHATITEALAAFQSEMPTISKANKATFAEYGGGGRSYGYADLADITKVAMPLLGKHGLAFTSIPTLDSEYGFVLVYELRHESGDYISGVYPLKPRETPEQQQGSAITYARRYTLCAVTGIAPGGDDDDAAAATAYRPKPEQPSTTHATAKPATEVVQLAQAWLDQIGEAQTQEELTGIYREANARGEASQEVMQSLTKRKAEVRHVPQSGEPVQQPAAQPAAVPQQ